MATFINTREWRKEEIKKAIIKVLEGTDYDHAKTASAIAEELRDILPYTVTVQSVVGTMGYMFEGSLIAPRRLVCRNNRGWYYLAPKVSG
jgi:hypothetical protein